MNKDPWKHRSNRMLCNTCIFYVEKVKVDEFKDIKEIKTLNEIPTPIGRCRRHAPTMNGYPTVFETDWCGEHKLDENRV